MWSLVAECTANVYVQCKGLFPPFRKGIRYLKFTLNETGSDVSVGLDPTAIAGRMIVLPVLSELAGKVFERAISDFFTGTETECNFKKIMEEELLSAYPRKPELGKWKDNKSPCDD